MHGPPLPGLRGEAPLPYPCLHPLCHSAVLLYSGTTLPQPQLLSPSHGILLPTEALTSVHPQDLRAQMNRVLPAMALPSQSCHSANLSHHPPEAPHFLPPPQLLSLISLKLIILQQFHCLLLIPISFCLKGRISRGHW